MRRFYLIILLLYAVCCYSQNLIPNNGFETINECPGHLSQIQLSNGWQNVTKGTPDLFHRCCSDKWKLKGKNCVAGVPSNSYGKCNAHGGDTYAGIFAYKLATGPTGMRDYREYIQIRLSKPLKKGEKYYLNFFVALADSSSYALKSIEAFLSPQQLQVKTDGPLKVSQQVISCYAEEHVWIDQAINWHRLKGTYLAKGGQQYITIGNFKNNLETQIQLVATEKQYPTLNYAYYYLDDFSLSLKDTIFGNDPFPTDHAFTIPDIYFNPNESIVLANAYNALEDIKNWLQLHPEYILEISGHTDSSGSESENLDLSKQRAIAIADYLILNGTDKSQLRCQGFGDTRPISSEKTPKGQQMNRRVEFRLIDR